ncbi:hypothetical protein PAPYR_8112 [Paratrimastix pyriformis]|uniref:Uncharacterized protein n=1 Tax=Paratrimastix pyriformis TaxID=342808 RepID=A0ABQ8UII2_9EUKA|nr:hypothetical protein PAPYR_8112 [Paratrimastix pyriformis]
MTNLAARDGRTPHRTQTSEKPAARLSKMINPRFSISSFFERVNFSSRLWSFPGHNSLGSLQTFEYPHFTTATRHRSLTNHTKLLVHRTALAHSPTRAQGPPTLVAHHPVLTVQETSPKCSIISKHDSLATNWLESIIGTSLGGIKCQPNGRRLEN